MKKKLMALSTLLILTLSTIALATVLPYPSYTNEQGGSIEISGTKESGAIHRSEASYGAPVKTPQNDKQLEPIQSKRDKYLHSPFQNIRLPRDLGKKAIDSTLDASTSSSSETIESGSSFTYWVKAGATGNGTTKDSPAGNITYALEQVTDGDVINVMEGRYTWVNEEFPLTIDTSDVTLNATGIRANTLIKGLYGPGPMATAVKIAANGVSITGFTITNSSIGISSDGYENMTIENNTIYNNHYTTDEVGKSIFLNDTDGATLIGNTIQDTDYGLTLSHSLNAMVRNNTFTGASKTAVSLGSSNSSTVKWNSMSSSEYGIKIADSLHDTVKNNTISGCDKALYPSGTYNHTIKNNMVGGELAYYFFHEANATIGPNGTLLNTTGKSLTHITVAMSNNITIHNLSITGDGLLLAHTNASTVANCTFASSYYGVYLDDTTNIEVMRNTFSGVMDTALEVDYSSDLLIAKNTFGATTDYGIYLSNSGMNAIKNNTISSSFGIGMVGLFKNCNHNTIRNNTISAGMYGILGLGAINNTIAKNTISGSSFSGIDLEPMFSFKVAILMGSTSLFKLSRGNEIINNTISGNGNGVSVFAGKDTTFHNNTISGNGNGISLRPYHWKPEMNGTTFYNWLNTTTTTNITNNTISGGSGDGIYANVTNMTNIAYNTISGNGNGVSFFNSSFIVAGYNTISGNGNGISATNSTKFVIGYIVSDGYTEGGVSIANNTISSNGNGVSITNSTGFLIKNNTIKGSSSDEIFLMGSSEGTIGNNTIIGMGGDYCLHLHNATSMGIKQNMINSTATKADLFIEGKTMAQYAHDVSDNTVYPKTNVTYDMLHYYNGTADTMIEDTVGSVHITVVNSNNMTVKNASVSGITSAFNTNVTVTNSTISGGFGVRFLSTDLSVVKNSKLASNLYGLKLESTRETEITGNLFYGNSMYGIHIDATSKNNEIYRNNFVLNGAYCASNRDGRFLHNYWSDHFSGAYTKIAGGICVDYYPLSYVTPYWREGEAPSVSITAPADGSYTTTGRMTVTWSGGDNFAVDHYEIEIGKGWTNMKKATSQTYMGLSDGDYTVTVKIVDSSNNTATVSVSFTCDRTAPSVTIDDPTAGETFESKESVDVEVSWSGSDANGISKYKARIDSKRWAFEGTGTSYTFTGLKNGTHTVRVKAWDTPGNANSTTVSFEVLIQAPEEAGISTLTWAGIGIGIGIAIVVIIAAAYYVTQRKKS